MTRMTAQEALDKARILAASPTKPRPREADVVLALRWYREADRLAVVDQEVEQDERIARRAIALMDVDRFTPSDWHNLGVAHDLVTVTRQAVRGRKTPVTSLAAAWRGVTALAKTLPHF